MLNTQRLLLLAWDNLGVGIIVHGERVDFIVREAVAPALLHIIEDERDAVVDVLLGIGVPGGEQFVLLRPAL